MPHSYDGTNYVPHDVLVSFAQGTIMPYILVRVPYMSKDDQSSTRQAIAELLAEEDMSKLPLQKVYEMCHDLIADYLENQDDLDEGHVRDYPITD